MKLKGSCHCRKVTFTVESYTPYPYMRCYCSICRKTAGGGGYAINIMGQADTLKVKGRRNISIYRAIMPRTKEGKPKKISDGRRHFCKKCGSCLWIADPGWPEWIYPFASCIDTDLPIPPERVHILLNSAANWVEIPHSKHDVRFEKYPKESIAEWHKRHRIYLGPKKDKTTL